MTGVARIALAVFHFKHVPVGGQVDDSRVAYPFKKAYCPLYFLDIPISVD